MSFQGSCNCGAIRFVVKNDPRGVSFCHCGQCRKQSGGVWSSAFVEKTDLNISGSVNWCASSDSGRRGFCPICGAFLFWKNLEETTISFALGAIDGPTGLTLEKHIFVADKGDYYEIADGVPQWEN
ncbi:MAG: GFA family protein [Pseudomonadota bacterium]